MLDIGGELAVKQTPDAMPLTEGTNSRFGCYKCCHVLIATQIVSNGNIYATALMQNAQVYR